MFYNIVNVIPTISIKITNSKINFVFFGILRHTIRSEMRILSISSNKVNL